MRKHISIDLDMQLVRQAAELLGTTGTAETVHAALADVAGSRRLGLFEIETDLSLRSLEQLRGHRFDERSAPDKATPAADAPA